MIEVKTIVARQTICFAAVFALLCFVSVYTSIAVAQEIDQRYQQAQSIFEQQIVPLLESSAVSSCKDCHLSYVNLNDYILGTFEETFISMRDLKLIDTQNPSESKILNMVRLSHPAASTETRKSRRKEIEAFHCVDWTPVIGFPN